MAKGTQTEEEVITEEKATEGKLYSGKRLIKLDALMKECLRLAKQTLILEFGEMGSMKSSSFGDLICELAVALFNKASVPDQTETMLTALEKGLEWYSKREEKQKSESAKIDEDFKASIDEVILPRSRSGLVVLIFNLLSCISRSAAEQFEMEQKRDVERKDSHS